MVNADEFCQFARLGQTSKIQKYLQTHYIDINALNLYGESALSTATYYNHILCVEFLLNNKADPKLHLSAGHTAVHIACRLANVPILRLLLSKKREEDDDDRQFQEKLDKHIYDCLRIDDHANLTPIHWAATQESVSKRQKMFAYLDRQMPGVLDSRYNINWFHSWAKTHSWVVEQKSTMSLPAILPVRLLPKLTNTDKTHRQYGEQSSSLPLTNVTPKTSINDYERIPIQPLTASTNGGYDKVYERTKRTSPRVEFLSELPPTPITSCTVASKNPMMKREQPCTQKQPMLSNNDMPTNSEKTPYSQRLSSMVDHSLSPRSTYRAERAHVIPTFTFPLSPTHTNNKPHKGHDYDDMITPISSKRPSHNLLSNIIPSTSTSSSDQSSRQSTKPFASFGFDTSMDLRNHNDTTHLESYIHHDRESNDEEENPDYESNQFDYLCNSASTLGISSPDADPYDL